MTRQRITIIGIAGAGLLASLTLALLLLARADRDPFAASAIRNPPFPSLTYGIQAFLWWDGGEAGFNLDWIEIMGLTHVKHTFAWRDLEVRRGEWDFSRADRVVDEITGRGLQVVARLGEVPAWALNDPAPDAIDTPPDDLDAWATYCGTLATRYAGRIVAYQVWNEPNLSREWGNRTPDAAGYTRLLAACSDAIRAGDPAAIVISAGLAPTGNHDAIAHRDDLYLQAMYDAGFQRYVDVVGVHAPGYNPPHVGPDDVVAQGGHRWMSFRRVEDMRRIMIANGDAARQMAILEVGYTTDPVNPAYSWFAVSEAEQAQRLSDAYAYAAQHWRPWVGLMSAIYMAKPTWTPDDEEYWWAFTEPNMAEGYIRIRPVVEAIARLPKTCGDTVTPPIPAEVMITRESANPCR